MEYDFFHSKKEQNGNYESYSKFKFKYESYNIIHYWKSYCFSQWNKNKNDSYFLVSIFKWLTHIEDKVASAI